MEPSLIISGEFQCSERKCHEIISGAQGKIIENQLLI